MTLGDIPESRWHKSSHSNSSANCVEVAVLPDGTHAVRDSKNPGQEPLRFSRQEWETFTASIRGGR